MISQLRAACALALLVVCLGVGFGAAQQAPASNAANEMPSVTTVPACGAARAQLQCGRGH